jgi:hypothetical protein
MIVEAGGREALGKGMKSVAARVARNANCVFNRTGRVLPVRFHLHVLRTPKEVRNAIRYVLLNHHKHARRSDELARLDPASSARWFDGWSNPSGKRRPRDPVNRPPTAPPRTWLLAVGWRRYGPIDPRDVPGRA